MMIGYVCVMCSIVVFNMNEVDLESMLLVFINMLFCEVGIII